MGIKELISQEKDLFICGEADNVNDAWLQIKEVQPTMIIVDISLKGSNGLSLIKDINKLDKNLPVLVLSMHDESIYAERSLNAGARGYIMKQETSELIILAIRQILEGKIYVSDKFIGSILQRITRGNGSEKSAMDGLTNRELEVFQLIGKGYSSSNIAGELLLSVKTIGTYRERIKEKLNLKTAAELAQHAALWVKQNNSN